MPDDGLLLDCAGRLFETGIYAHAPAKHVYHTGKKWQAVAGHVGLAAGHHGSVRFEIQGDGKTLWTSTVIRSGQISDFHIGIDDVQQLQLLTHPTNDGPGSDWGFWLNPRLTTEKGDNPKNVDDQKR